MENIIIFQLLTTQVQTTISDNTKPTFVGGGGGKFDGEDLNEQDQALFTISGEVCAGERNTPPPQAPQTDIPIFTPVRALSFPVPTSKQINKFDHYEMKDLSVTSMKCMKMTYLKTAMTTDLNEEYIVLRR